MTEEGAGIVMKVKNLGGAEEKVDLDIEIHLTQGIKVRREGVFLTESWDILYGSVRNRKGVKLSEESKRHR